MVSILADFNEPLITPLTLPSTPIFNEVLLTLPNSVIIRSASELTQP